MFVVVEGIQHRADGPVEGGEIRIRLKITKGSQPGYRFKRYRIVNTRMALP